jgi:aryl-alcohol dehydrogenase-like predicted oxidoreductase
MRTTTLGGNGPEVGVIGLGCMGMSFGYDMRAPRDDTTSIAVIRQALDLGMTLLDTADVYGPYTNEELVGRALAGGRRERAVLATKAGLVVSDPTGGPDGSPLVVNNGRPEHIRAAIDASLRRLGTDHVDLYQLHRVDPQVPLAETWGAMAEIVAAGKARHIGLSEVSVDQIKQAQAVHPVASVQSEFSLWTRDPLAEVLPYCERQGIAFLPFSPSGSGEPARLDRALRHGAAGKPDLERPRTDDHVDLHGGFRLRRQNHPPVHDVRDERPRNDRTRLRRLMSGRHLRGGTRRPR